MHSEILTTPDAPFIIERRTTDEQTFRHRDTITFIVATTERQTLQRTLDSIELRAGDELLLVKPKVPSGLWGHPERNFAMPYARCAWLAHIDDDDWYVPGHRALQAQAIAEIPGHRPVPIIFRMQFTSGLTFWKEGLFDPKVPGRPLFKYGNIGTPMVLMPNIPAMLHPFDEDYGGDFAYINGAKCPRRLYVFRPEILVQIGHPGPSGKSRKHVD